jgi:hypothetical protein
LLPSCLLFPLDLDARMRVRSNVIACERGF